nr:troponin I-like [Aegilops tauschii subsp. strangulata]
MPMEEEETNLGAGGSTPATNVGGEGATSSQPGAGASSADQENIYTVIEEVARDAEAEADKIAAEEAAKTAAKEADVEKTQEVVKEHAAKDEADRHQHQAELNSQEEDLVASEGVLAATLRCKDEEVKELDVEKDGLKEQVLGLVKEKDRLNGALVEAQAAVLGKAE